MMLKIRSSFRLNILASMLDYLPEVVDPSMCLNGERHILQIPLHQSSFITFLTSARLSEAAQEVEE